MGDSSQFGKWISNPPPGEEVVISGLSGHFPESRNVREFQENLFNKREMVLDNRRYKLDHPEVPRRTGQVEGVDKLDAGYFGLHHRQANIMDPMTRKFLECTIEAIMDAGINPSELQGTKTGVFVGACYADMETETLSNITNLQTFAITGYLRSIISRRISYFLKLKGTSCVLDTACSSSLNALELAFKQIRMGRCDNAIVGGVNVLLHPGVTRQFFRLGVLSQDATCKVFDEKADGYVRTEAIACVFLQKAKNARRVYAKVIYGKVNGDGFKSLGITYPSSQMQKELMTEIFQDSGVDPSELSFMEAHGTGTQVGDPQEVEAIDDAIATKRRTPLLTGSVKSSIGHSEPASGLCSLTKVIIAMEAGYIAPNINIKNIKKGLTGFEEGRMKLVTELTELDKGDAIIGINNFGFGGNNCHLLVQRHTKIKLNKGLPEDDLPRLVCVSGRTKQAVSLLLEDVNNRPLDGEYVGLLHQIFKRDIINNVYRGFTIVSKNGPVKTDSKLFIKKSPLYIIFGNFVKKYKLLGEYLMQFPSFKYTINKINGVLSEEVNMRDTATKIRIQASKDILGSFAVQLGLVNIFKLLHIEPTRVYGNSFGKVVCAFYWGKITLEEAVHEICEIAVGIENIDIDCDQKVGSLIAQMNHENTFDNVGTYSSLTRGKGSVILNISDDILKNDNVLLLVKDKRILFLEVLGRLYEEGYDLELYKLYPPIEFPVSRTTAMISPLICWDHRKSWYFFTFGKGSEKDITQKEFNLVPSSFKEQQFLYGHVIDGRTLIPASYYLEIVRETFVHSFKKTEMDSLPIAFENCKFIRAVTFLESGAVKLLVSIQQSNGYFEVVEKNAVIATGRIYLDLNIEDHQIDLPSYDLDEKTTEFLQQDEIYRELFLRGYNYSGVFKGVVKSNVDVSAALIKWENNWTSFIDKMLQMKILQLDTRSLYIPTGIRKLTMNMVKHLSFVGNCEDFLCPAYSSKTSNVIKSGGIEISGLHAVPIHKRKYEVTPVLEKYVFVPNKTRIHLEDSVRVITQIVLENSLENCFKAVEILDDQIEANSELLSSLFSKALDDLPLVIVDLVVSSKNEVKIEPPIKVENVTLTPGCNLSLIIATKMFQNPTLLNQALSAVSPNGFLLTREESAFSLGNTEDIEIIIEHTIDTEKLVLFRKSRQEEKTVFVQVSSDNFNWLPQVQTVLKTDSDIVLFNSQKSELEGILGLVNCIRREPKGSKVRCCFMMDPAPKFDIEDPFYKNQLKKQMAANIYKDGKWGTYRHLLLENVQEVKSSHFFVKNTVKGDLSSLKWVEGNLSTATKLEKGSTLVFPYYSALNFKDIMIASGRVSVDTFTEDRIEQEYCQGFEFCGRDTKGCRVMGMATKAGIGTMVVADSDFLMEIPDDWSWQDASTVVVVYSTVVYGLFKDLTIEPGMSILIHSATGGIGLAAINVCLYHGFDIFVTVGTQEKRDYIKKHFPEIPESHIGNSRDESFEEMIKSETKGRGVDILLNSLSEEKLRASVRCVANGGNFLEIGKFDLGIDAALSLLLLERNVSYHGVMLDRLFTQPSHMKRQLVNKIYEGIKLGYIKPLPRTIFKQDEIVQAYKYMTTGKHIGKVVIKIRDENDTAIDPTTSIFKGTPRFTCNSEKSYVILGGLGGVGLELADWLYLRGAKRLVLVSRVGIQSGYQKQRIKNWRSYGVNVQISTRDVTTENGCLDLITEANRLGPVEAVFNLAVVLRDGLFDNLNEEAFTTCFAPKARATMYLDQVTREHCPQLKYFVVFSSVSCGRGNSGQTNYGMANSIMERICEKRKREFLPGLAIQWGAIGDVGLVAKMQKENRELIIGGTLQQRISSCLEVLDQFLKQDNPIVASMVVAEKTKRKNSDSPVNAVAYILGIKDIKTVGLYTSFAELGLDSMMAVEMIQTLEKDFGIFITAKEVRNMTFAKLMELENDQMNGSDPESKPTKGIDAILKYVPREYTNDSPVLKLPSKVEDGTEAITVFLLPGVESVFDGTETFTKNLKAHVFGIPYDYRSGHCTVQEIAQEIIPHVERIVAEKGIFYIMGYSFGTIVAIELASILEAKGFTGHLILIEGSPAYISTLACQYLPAHDENEFQTLVLFRILEIMLPIEPFLKQKDKFLKCKTFDERMELAKSQVPKEVTSKEDLEKQAIVALYNRLKATISYHFEHPKIKSPVHLFKAKFPAVSDFVDDYRLSELCQQVQVTLLEGDHLTILHQEQLIDSVNKIFSM